MKKALVLFLLVVLTVNVSAQECFQWKNLKLNSTSLAEAVGVLGKPKKDRVEPAKFDEGANAAEGELVNFRKLKYKKIDIYNEVELIFLNEKLFSLEFTPEKKKILAADLGKNFNAEFLFVAGLSQVLKFADYEGQKETTVPKIYPTNYYMLSVKRNCAIVAAIDNNSWKAIWRDGVNKTTAEMFPGTVKSIQIFSRETRVK